MSSLTKPRLSVSAAHRVDEALAKSLTRKLDLLRDELVERIVACWLHLHHLEAVYAGKESMSLELGS
jgi:hypothetical protein